MTFETLLELIEVLYCNLNDSIKSVKSVVFLWPNKLGLIKLGISRNYGRLCVLMSRCTCAALEQADTCKNILTKHVLPHKFISALGTLYEHFCEDFDKI